RGEVRQEYEETPFVVEVCQDDNQRCEEEEATDDVGLLPSASLSAWCVGVFCVSRAQGLALSPALVGHAGHPSGCPLSLLSPRFRAQDVVGGEQGDAGGYAAIGISSTSRSMSGYQRLNMAPSSPLSVRTRVCNKALI